MEVGKLTVDYRKDLGKGSNRKLRSSGKIPGVCYGGEKEPMPLSIDPTLLVRALDPIKKSNTVINLTVKDAPQGNSDAITVMVRAVQKDPVRGHLTHADFVRVALDKDVHAVIPVVLTGKAEGIKDGGILHHNIRNLEIACRPDQIPAKLEVDVTPLKMGDAIHVSDLKLGAGIRALADAASSVCSVTAPRAEKVETPVEAIPGAEGAAPAAAGAAPAAAGAAPAAAGAKPAAGDKAAAAPAAAPAKGGGEKKGK
jgi:large subunit ribosomal protein L25